MRAREDRVAVELALHLAAQRIDLLDGLDLVAEELDADRGFALVGRKDLDDVAAHAERAAVEVDVVALVLDVDQRRRSSSRRNSCAFDQVDEQAVVALGRADAVDAAHRGDDDHVACATAAPASRAWRMRSIWSLMIASLSMNVSRRRDVGLGLVVVVVADEVLDGVVGEEVAHLAVELCGERLVRREDQRRLLDMLDDVRDREGLAGAGDPEKNLVPFLPVHARAQLGDRRRLIAAGDEF